MHNCGIDTILVRGDNVIISGEKGLLMQYLIRDDEQIKADIQEHEELKKSKQTFDKDVSDISGIKTSNISCITFPQIDSTLKKTETLDNSQEWGANFVQENYNVDIRQTSSHISSHNQTQMPPKPTVSSSTKNTSNVNHFHRETTHARDQR